jgi:hypothetical protein
MEKLEDGTIEWTKKDWEALMKWRAKELGLSIKKSKSMIEVQVDGLTLLGVENWERWSDQVDLFLQGYEWGYNSGKTAEKRLSCGMNNFPPYAKLR